MIRQDEMSEYTLDADAMQVEAEKREAHLYAPESQYGYHAVATNGDSAPLGGLKRQPTCDPGPKNRSAQAL